MKDMKLLSLELERFNVRQMSKLRLEEVDVFQINGDDDTHLNQIIIQERCLSFCSSHFQKLRFRFWNTGFQNQRLFMFQCFISGYKWF